MTEVTTRALGAGVAVALALMAWATAASAQGLANKEEAGVKKEDERPVRISLAAQYRALAVVDEDPANDQILVYRLRAQAQVFAGASVFASFGLLERFVAEEGESAFLLQDTQMGFAWNTPVDLGVVRLGILHEIVAFLPTSRASQNRDLIVAPMVRQRWILSPAPGLSITFLPYFRYRFHQYAEQAGQLGGMNLQLDLGTRGGVDYVVFDSGRWGSVVAGGSVGSAWARTYDSRDGHDSMSSDQGAWSQFYDWEAHVFYTPTPILNVGVSVEQFGSVLRDGVVNMFLTHRDETVIALTLLAIY